MNDANEIKWVPLHILPGKIYAEMVMEVLKNHGIPCYAKSHLRWGMVSGAGLVGSDDQIMVPEDRFKEAEAILNDMLDHI